MADATAEVSVVQKLDNFLRDVRYRSLMLNSANFNIRLQRERKTRLPYDTQTGIVQQAVHTNVAPKHRLPGVRFGQIYAYPCRRWYRKKRTCMPEPSQTAQESTNSEVIVQPFEAPVISGTADDSNVSMEGKSDMYYYDDTPFLEEDEYDLDNEDDDTYSTRTSKRAKRKLGKLKVPRGRKRREPRDYKILDVEEDQIGKPYECSLCGARYKTRQGLSYHLSHTHGSRNAAAKATSNSDPSPMVPTPQQPTSFEHHDTQQQYTVPSGARANLTGSKQGTASGGSTTTEYQDSYLGFLAASQQQLPGFSNDGVEVKENKISSIPEESKSLPSESFQNQTNNNNKRKGSERARPNDYCDFCLGTAECNNKIGEAEAMVSCADCGRSGHLTCLQFSANMIISVKQYPWQCLECKCCTLCGTSENDDKLLFCDDCDRGYHLYCLETPLAEPPEGEWSCALCLQQFHTKN